VAQHAARVALPWLGIWAAAFAHVLADLYRVASVFAVNDAGAFFVILLEIHSVELGVAVDDSRPAIDPDHRDDSALVWKREQLTGKRVQAVLLRDNQKHGHLRVCDLILALKTRCFERVRQICAVSHSEAVSQLCGQCCKCGAHVVT
jgi:hypothetical protein